MKIAIDIGHARGTGTQVGDVNEHDVAARIAGYLRTYLEQSGHSVTVLDYPDMSNRDDLNATIEAAREAWYNLGISIHTDASDNESAHGAHVCYTSAKGQMYATRIGQYVGALLPGRADMIVRRTDLAILNRTPCPWVLVECGFLTNPADREIQTTKPEVIAQAIAEGVNSVSV